MKLEHVAIWTTQLEALKEYYIKYFEAVPNKKYTNPKTRFQSYFLTFSSGARLELMERPDIPENRNDVEGQQHMGIIHLAFGVENRGKVDAKAAHLQGDGFKILKGPRETGDGYYEFETLDLDGNRLEVTTSATNVT